MPIITNTEDLRVLYQKRTLKMFYDYPVGNGIEVWMASGIRSGQGGLKAWALGACYTMIGRPFLSSLDAMGEVGVTRCLEVIHNELDLTMVFTGHRDVQHVTKDILYLGTFKP